MDDGERMPDSFGRDTPPPDEVRTCMEIAKWIILQVWTMNDFNTVRSDDAREHNFSFDPITNEQDFRKHLDEQIKEIFKMALTSLSNVCREDELFKNENNIIHMASILMRSHISHTPFESFYNMACERISNMEFDKKKLLVSYLVTCFFAQRTVPAIIHDLLLSPGKLSFIA